MKDVRPSSLELAKALENFVYNEIDVITESDWFQEKITMVIKESFTDKEVLEKIWDNRYKSLKEERK